LPGVVGRDVPGRLPGVLMVPLVVDGIELYGRGSGSMCNRSIQAAVTVSSPPRRSSF
jgi:hypothetical protein